jgi:hypothetical protein
MQMTRNSAARLGRLAGLCVLAGGLGGCYSMAGGGGGSGGAAAKAAATPAAVTPAKFSTFVGTMNAKGVNTQSIVNAFDPTVRTYTVETKDKPDDVVAYVKTPDPDTKLQDVDVKARAGFFSNKASFESNGAAFRGHATSDDKTWAVVSNSPGSRLDSSLGSMSLESSFAGVAAFGPRMAGRTGTSYSYASGFFGGQTAGNMPTSGRAEYIGAFEGIEESTVNGSESVRRNISGKANLTADFAARSVSGRIDDINNHNLGPIKVPAGYSLAFDGRITNTEFSGAAWMTNRNSNAPLDFTPQNSGVVQGGFFGPGAAETAGALGVATGDSVRKSLITGAFGAKKK